MCACRDRKPAQSAGLCAPTGIAIPIAPLQPPSASSWIRQAMRFLRKSLFRERAGCPKRTRYFAASSAPVMRLRTASSAAVRATAAPSARCAVGVGRPMLPPPSGGSWAPPARYMNALSGEQGKVNQRPPHVPRWDKPGEGVNNPRYFRTARVRPGRRRQDTFRESRQVSRCQSLMAI